MRFPLVVSRRPAVVVGKVGGSLRGAELPVAIAFSVWACCAAMSWVGLGLGLGLGLRA